MIISKKESHGKSTLSDFKLLHGALVIEIGSQSDLWCHRDRHRYLQNEIEDTNNNVYHYDHIVFDSYPFDRGLLSRIYKVLKKSRVKKTVQLINRLCNNKESTQNTKQK